MWKAVVENLPNIDKWWQSIIASRNFNTEDCWSCGLMIFAPYSWSDGISGLKNCFLPLLNDVPVEMFPMVKKGME